MATNVHNQIVQNLKSSEYFSIQFDKSTDVANLAQFLCFVRYECDGTIKENMLFCKSIPGHATGQGLFELFIETTKNEHLDWNKCISVCSDGARAITGKNSGLMVKLKELMSHIEWIHCFLHRLALAAKKMPDNLKNVLSEAVKIVNYINSRPLQCRLFSTLCEEMGSKNKSLLFYTEVRWLSRGKVLTRIFELRNELQIFFKDKNSTFSTYFQDNETLLFLAYLSDIFSH